MSGFGTIAFNERSYKATALGIYTNIAATYDGPRDYIKLPGSTFNRKTYTYSTTFAHIEGYVVPVNPADVNGDKTVRNSSIIVTANMPAGVTAGEFSTRLGAIATVINPAFADSLLQGLR